MKVQFSNIRFTYTRTYQRREFRGVSEYLLRENVCVSILLYILRTHPQTNK